MVAERSGIIRGNGLLTTHFGPHDMLLTRGFDFADRLSLREVEDTISDREAEIKTRFPELSRVFIEAQSWRSHCASPRRAEAAAASAAEQ